jgi:soluble lytic murein transglycosylase-like protein
MATHPKPEGNAMKRYVPEVRALYERVRRPAITLLVGLGMFAPLGFTLFSSPTPEPRVSALDDAASRVSSSTSDLRVGEVETAAPTPAEAEVSKATAAKPAAAVAKSEPAASPAAKPERSAPAAATFARQFKIPVSLADQIHRAAEAEGIEPRIAFGLVQTESSFRRSVISSAGAVGYTQLLPSTARWIAPGTTRSQLFNTQTNLRVGFKYLNYLVDKYNGNMRLALTAYNRGPGTVDRLLKQGRNPENGYATKVLRSRA